MKAWYVILLLILGLLAGDIWELTLVFAPPAPVPTTSQELMGPGESEGTPMPEPTSMPGPAAKPTLHPTGALSPTPSRLPAAAPTLTTFVPPSPPLPALYVDGPYIKRSDTNQPVWLKGVNIEEFRQGTRHTLADLYTVQGLRIVSAPGWGINLLRVMVDPELVPSTSLEIDKAILFAQENGMYVILVPAASVVNPSRSERRLTVPDDLVATAMGYLAARFRDRTNVLYAIWNEPHPDSIVGSYDEQWQIWMQAGIKVAQAIRNRNPQAILVVPGGDEMGERLDLLQRPPFSFRPRHLRCS